MSDVELKFVVSCSSEDKSYPAKSLLEQYPSRPWKCSAPGEKDAVVIFQFDKACRIQKIDIGNAGSAFVEVLVGRSSDNENKFQVLIPSAVFMTPDQSKKFEQQHISKVRMFDVAGFQKPVATAQWDRLKLVCTQPFNRAVQYGLAFVRVFSVPETDVDAASSIPKVDRQLSLGRFTLRSEGVLEEKNDNSFAPGSMFAKRNQSAEPLNLSDTSPALIRQAEESLLKKSSQTSGHLPLARSTAEEKGKRHATREGQPAPPDVVPKRPKTAASYTPTQPKLTTSPPPNFDQLLQDVTFVISGIQNPERGQLRAKALEMGAQYKPDWTKQCTHLVCAFANTPKYNQVKGKGKIVKKEWILDCYRQKRRLDWKKYTFEPVDDEDDVTARDNGLAPSHAALSSQAASSKADEERYEKPAASSTFKAEDAKCDDVYNVPTDDGESDSESGNTDDELQRAQHRPQKPTRVPPAKPTPANVDVGPDGLPLLPDYFKNMRFFLHGDFPQAERRQLKRFVTTFDGHEEPYMSAAVTHVVTQDGWDESYDDALKEYPGLVFVTPDWILTCGRLGKLVDVKDYQIHSRATS